MEATLRTYSTEQERSLDKRRGRGEWLLAVVLLVVVLAAAGCAGTLDKAMATCFALEGSPSYTRAEGIEKFDCQRPGATVARASR